MADRTFDFTRRGKYTFEEIDALGKLCEKYKLEYDEKLNTTSGQVATYNEEEAHKSNTSERIRCQSC